MNIGFVIPAQAGIQYVPGSPPARGRQMYDFLYINQRATRHWLLQLACVGLLSGGSVADVIPAKIPEQD
jgi:hypothetical protein